jgi:hypothetical protein
MNEEQQVGTATYRGDDQNLINKFGNWNIPLFNSEGFYVRDETGKQILTNNKEWVYTLYRE